MKIFAITLRITAATATAIVISSCAYDPFSYSSTSSTYSSGYGRSSTTVFFSTGDPRWGYDPVCRSYYDYTRKCYYDPYLNGYYPRGYRPTIVVGAPHPHGWNPGKKFCPPPRSYSNRSINNYRERAVAYRNLNHSWSKKVHVKSNNGNQQPSWNNRQASNSSWNSHRESENSRWNRSNQNNNVSSDRYSNRSNNSYNRDRSNNRVQVNRPDNNRYRSDDRSSRGQSSYTSRSNGNQSATNPSRIRSTPSINQPSNSRASNRPSSNSSFNPSSSNNNRSIRSAAPPVIAQPSAAPPNNNSNRPSPGPKNPKKKD